MLGSKIFSKDLKFFKVINQKDFPGYFKHYVLEDEKVLVAYKTNRDHAIFTNNKLVIFDSFKKLSRKSIYTLPFKNIAFVSITFDIIEARLDIYLNNGYHMILDFVDLEAEDKVRLRLLYTYISRLISDEEIPKDILNKLVKDDVKIETKK